MKEYLLIILMVLASVICSVLCRQLIRSNEQIRRQITEMEGKIEEAKTPKVIVSKSQAIQHQSVCDDVGRSCGECGTSSREAGSRKAGRRSEKGHRNE